MDISSFFRQKMSSNDSLLKGLLASTKLRTKQSLLSKQT